MRNQVINPFTLFLALDGQALDTGHLYVGRVGADAEAEPVDVYWDEAGVSAAAQPLRIRQGLIIRSGRPAQVFGPVEYSLRVRDGAGRLVMEAARVTGLPGAMLEVEDLPLTSPGKGARRRSIGEKLDDMLVDLLDFVDPAAPDHTAGFDAAIRRANEANRKIRLPRGTFILSAPLTRMTDCQGMIGAGSGATVINATHRGDILDAKGSYKHFEGLRIQNMSPAGAGQRGAAALHIRNCAYGRFKDIFTAHDLDGYGGIKLEHEYDGSEADASFVSHLGCWYNVFEQCHALYARFGENRGYGLWFASTGRAVTGVSDPPGQRAGTYYGSVGNNVIVAPNIEGKADGIRFEGVTACQVVGGQLLGCGVQIRLINSRQNIFTGVKHNQWVVSPVEESGSAGRNSYMFPLLFHVVPSPWRIGTLDPTSSFIHVGEGVVDPIVWQARHKLGVVDLDVSQLPTAPNDAVAATVGVQVGHAYKTAGGEMRYRVA